MLVILIDNIVIKTLDFVIKISCYLENNIIDDLIKRDKRTLKNIYKI